WVLSNYEDALAAALLTPTAPDVFEYANGPTLDMIKAGQVADVTETLGDAGAEFTPSVLARMTYDDKIWAIPQTVDMQLLYYRRSALSEAGVQPPTTLEQLATVAEAVAGGSFGGFYAGQDGGIGVLGLLLMWASGANEFNEARTEAAFNTPALHAAVAQYKALFDSPGMVKAASADWSDASPFNNGECALQWGGLWDLPKVTAAHGDDVGVLPFPAAGGDPVVPFGAFSACVSAASANPDVAQQYVRWLWVDSDDKQVEFSNAFGTHIPAKPSLFSRASQVASGPGAEAAAFVTDHGRANALFWTSACGQAYSTALSNVVLNGADAAAEFGAAEQSVNAELARING
ncbi:MAG: extracellular solute-binding protein, partial [Propionibacteriaceae bacterium]|nr:extracellular solute-binding protein [Propionibacteriaceae bacterium]